MLTYQTFDELYKAAMKDRNPVGAMIVEASWFTKIGYVSLCGMGLALLYSALTFTMDIKNFGLDMGIGIFLATSFMVKISKPYYRVQRSTATAKLTFVREYLHKKLKEEERSYIGWGSSELGESQQALNERLQKFTTIQKELQKLFESETDLKLKAMVKKRLKVAKIELEKIDRALNKVTATIERIEQFFKECELQIVGISRVERMMQLFDALEEQRALAAQEITRAEQAVMNEVNRLEQSVNMLEMICANSGFAEIRHASLERSNVALERVEELATKALANIPRKIAT